MDHRPALSNRHLLFYTLYLAYIAAGALSILPGPTLPLLAQHTGVTLDKAGWIFTSLASGFAIGVMIAGLLSKRLGPKSILMIGLFLMATNSIVTPWTHMFSLMLASQFLMGIGFGFLDVSINILVSLSFQETLSQTLIGLHSSFGLGALVAPLLLSLALTAAHDPIWAYLTGSVIAFICIALLMPQRAPRPATSTSTGPSVQRALSPRLFGQLLLWLMALEFFFYIAAEVGFSDWIVTAVSQSAAISLALAAPAATTFWLGLTVSRLLSAQVIKRAILNERQLLYLCIFGGGLSVLLAALFPGQLVIVFSASACVGFFFGPLFPGLLAIASRWFAHALGTISGVLLISSGISGMIFPVFMGILIPSIGIQWVMTIPAVICLLIAVPFSLANRKQRRTLQLHEEEHTIKGTSPLPTIGHL